jgi:hypothetical protein
LSQVVHRQLRTGAKLTMPKCFEMETTIAREFMRQNGEQSFSAQRALLLLRMC